MADGFDAGSILVSLKAKLDDFNAGIASAKQTLASLGESGKQTAVAFKELDTSVVVFQEIETGSSRLTRVFNDLERETGRSTTAFQGQAKATDQLDQTHTRANNTFARSANRIIGIQIALLSLSSTANGPLKEALQGVSNGVAAFGAAMQLTQGRIGAFNAGLLGAGVAAISFYSRSLEEGIKATDATTKSENDARRSLTQLADAFSDAKVASSAFARTGLEDAKQQLSSLESIFASNQKRLREIPDQIADINQKLGAEQGKPWYERSSTAVKQYKDQIDALQYTMNNLKRTNADIANQAPFAKANEQAQQIGQNLEKVNKELQDTQDIGARAIRLGVEEPAAAAAANLTEAKKKLDEVLADEIKLKDLAATPGLTDAQRAQLLSRVNSLDVSGAVNGYKKALEDKRLIDATNDLAKTFATSVGDGLRDAILNSKKPMEALAGIGQNLFANMVDQTIKRLETGLTDAFKAITGAAGEGIGLALTGILGAAGAILSKLGSKGSDSFGNVQSAVTSTAAVRGIVAGPSSVAIATIGDNLSRAMVPVVTLLGIGNGLLQQIANNTRGGGRGGPGSSNVVQTA